VGDTHLLACEAAGGVTESSPGELAAKIVFRVEALPARDTAAVRQVRRGVSRQFASSQPELVIDIAFCLLERTEFLYHFVAYELVRYHRQALASVDEALLERLGRGINSWYAVDTFGVELSGQVWRSGQIPDDTIRRWATSDDRWWRRASLVSTVPLNIASQGGGGDTLRTLDICSLLIDDRDDMVVKAMSWALRVLSGRDREAVERFLAEHQDRLAPRVLREVRNKLDTGLKSPKRH
jgi:3-methyladenine DNA glycosylase AlkD